MALLFPAHSLLAANEMLPAYGRIAYTTGSFTTSVKVEEDAFQHKENLLQLKAEIDFQSVQNSLQEKMNRKYCKTFIVDVYYNELMLLIAGLSDMTAACFG